MEKTYKYRIYPNTEQKEFLSKQLGCCRFVYNYLLERSENEYKESKKSFNYYDSKKQLPILKKEYPWLKDVNSQSLQASVTNLKKAYDGFFRKKAKFPRYKSKKSDHSCHIPQNFSINKNCITIPKLKSAIKIRLHREIEGEIKNLSITKTASNQYYVNILVDEEIKKLPSNKQAVALDLGITTLAKASNGKDIESKKFIKEEKLIRKVSRQLSKKVYKSNNYRKAVVKLARKHQKHKNKRSDHLHKASIRIVRENQTIILEDLNVKGMIRNHKLSKAIANASWGQLKRQIQYKAKWHGREVIEVDRFYPSSKTCCICGYKKEDLHLSIKKWICPKCKTFHDRDYNAAIGLLKVGLEQSECTPVDYAMAAEQRYLLWSTSHHRVEAGSFPF